MANADLSFVNTYNDHYSSNDRVEREWTELRSHDRLNNTLKVIGERQFHSTLDVGAGDGAVLQRLDRSEKFGSLSAVDISDSAVQIIKSLPITKLEEAKSFDGYQIPFESDRFDLATCYHVIEHVEHPRILLREIARISRYQVFEIPLDYRVGIDAEVEHYIAYGHISIYTPSLFKFLLKSEGFNIINEHLSDLSWESRKFMILNSSRNSNPRIRLLKSRLSTLKKSVQRALSSSEKNREFSYYSYTCLCEFKGKPTIAYNQQNLW